MDVQEYSTNTFYKNLYLSKDWNLTDFAGPYFTVHTSMWLNSPKIFLFFSDTTGFDTRLRKPNFAQKYGHYKGQKFAQPSMFCRILFLLERWLNTCHGSILVMAQYLSWLNTCHGSILVIAQYLSRLNTWHGSILVMAQYLSLLNTCHGSILVMAQDL